MRQHLSMQWSAASRHSHRAWPRLARPPQIRRSSDAHHPASASTQPLAAACGARVNLGWRAMAERACMQRGPGKCQESPKLLGAAGLCTGVALGMQKACHGLRISFPALCCTCFCAAFPGTLFCLGKQALSMTGWGSPHYISPLITSFRCRLKAGSTLHARLASSWQGAS